MHGSAIGTGCSWACWVIVRVLGSGRSLVALHGFGVDHRIMLSWRTRCRTCPGGWCSSTCHGPKPPRRPHVFRGAFDAAAKTNHRHDEEVQIDVERLNFHLFGGLLAEATADASRWKRHRIDPGRRSVRRRSTTILSEGVSARFEALSFILSGEMSSLRPPPITWTHDHGPRLSLAGRCPRL